MPEITPEVIMATGPCPDFPEERVAHLLSTYGPFASWDQLVAKSKAEL